MAKRQGLLVVLLLALLFLLGGCSWLQDEFLFVYHPADNLQVEATPE